MARRPDRPTLYKPVQRSDGKVAELHSTKGEYRRNLKALGVKRKRKHLARMRRKAEHAVRSGHGYEPLKG